MAPLVGTDLDFLASIIENSEDAIITKDLRGIVTSWNRAAQRIFGYTAGEMIGQPIQRLFPPDRLDEEPAILERIAKGERVEHFETQRVRKDGKVIDVSVTISPLRDEDGRLVGASKIARDITQQRANARAQALLAAIVDSSDEAILAIDLEGRITSWNRGAQKLYGYTAEEILGQPMGILLPKGHEGDAQETLDAITAGQTLAREQAQRRRKDGTLIDVAITASPMRDPEGNIVGIAAVGRDVTLHRQRDAAERAASQERIDALQEAAQVRGQFISSVAHELANPLSPIKIQLSILAKHAKGDEVAHSVGILERSFRRIDRGIKDLLDAARIEANRLRLEKGPVALRPLVEFAAASFEAPAAENGVRLVADRCPDITVLGDEGRLTQVLINLLSNALKFTPRGGQVTIRVSTPPGRVRIGVQDTGAGMTAQQIDALFQPYQQVHDPDEHHVGGMGLGLYISKALVEGHGGRLWADSDGPGHGTTMWMELPLGPQRPAAAAAKADWPTK